MSGNHQSQSESPGQGHGVSVLILTLNEEANLPKCLASVSWSDDIVVLDSGSTDRTVEIAKAAGARVVHRVLDNWSAHQNWAVANIQFKHPWVLYIDADETATPELGQEVQEVARQNGEPVAYRIRRKEMLWGRWLKHSSMYPVWHLRFFRPDRIRWERLVHPEAVVDGSIGRLQEHIVHYSFSKGLEPWIAKHIEYARLEAIEAVRVIEAHEWDLAGLLSLRDPVRRRKALKIMGWHLPCRPLWRFLYMYILRLGCLDGGPGYYYCRLISTYQYMIDCTIRENRRRARNLPI